MKKIAVILFNIIVMLIALLYFIFSCGNWDSVELFLTKYVKPFS